MESREWKKEMFMFGYKIFLRLALLKKDNKAQETGNSESFS